MKISELLKQAKSAKEILAYMPQVEMYVKVVKSDYIANLKHTILVAGDYEIDRLVTHYYDETTKVLSY